MWDHVGNERGSSGSFRRSLVASWLAVPLAGRRCHRATSLERATRVAARRAAIAAPVAGEEIVDRLLRAVIAGFAAEARAR